MSPAFRNVLVASAVLKIALAIVFGELTPHYDEKAYERFARAIHEDGAPSNLLWAPLYQYLLALGMTLSGGRIVGGRLLQVVLSVATSWLAYRTGRRLHGERAGFWLGTALAFYPSQVAFSHLLWSETLYLFFVVLALDRLLDADHRGGWPRAAAAGIALGLCTLTRSTGLVLIAASALWLVVGRGRRGLGLAAVTLAAAAALVGPWSAVATSRAGAFVLVDLNATYNLWAGNNRYIPPDVQAVFAVGLPLDNGLNQRFRAYYPYGEFRQGKLLERMTGAGVREAATPEGAAWFREDALETIRGDPAGVLRRLPKKLAALWAPDFFLPRHLLRDWYGPTPPPLAVLLTVITWMAAAVPLIGGPACLAALRGGRFRALALAWIGAYLLVHGLAFGQTRLHQPLVPVLLLAASAFLFDPDERPDLRRLLRRGLPWAGIVLAAWVMVWPLLGGLYIHPGPRHAAMARVLAAGRELPLPGTRWQAWMLAGVEASSGREREGARLLEQSRHAEEPWSYYLRALMAPSGPAAETLLEEALQRDPDLEPAQLLIDHLRTPKIPQ